MIEVLTVYAFATVWFAVAGLMLCHGADAGRIGRAVTRRLRAMRTNHAARHYHRAVRIQRRETLRQARAHRRWILAQYARGTR